MPLCRYAVAPLRRYAVAPLRSSLVTHAIALSGVGLGGGYLPGLPSCRRAGRVTA